MSTYTNNFFLLVGMFRFMLTLLRPSEFPCHHRKIVAISSKSNDVVTISSKSFKAVSSCTLRPDATIVCNLPLKIVLYLNPSLSVGAVHYCLNLGPVVRKSDIEAANIADSQLQIESMDPKDLLPSVSTCSSSLSTACHE